MKKCSIWIFLAVFFIIFNNNILLAAAPENPMDILILHSYSPDYEWTQSEQLGIEQVFKPLAAHYQLRTEYMDLGHSELVRDGTLLKQLYKNKFSNSNFQAIIVTDNVALDFLHQYRDEIFPGVPVIFCGINSYDTTEITNHAGFTGITEDNDFLGLFTIISKLQPNLQHIIVYGTPDDPTYLANSSHIKKQLETASFPVEFREFPTIDACIEDGKTLTLGNVILLAGNMHAESGGAINLQHSTELMSQAVTVPIYTIWDFAVNHGAVGGLVISGVEQGQQAAAITLNILNGKSIDELPVSPSIASTSIFDYNQLTRFNLSTARLPADALIINSPNINYTVKQGIIWTGTFAIAFLFLIIFILVKNIRKRKTAEAALRTSQEKFSKAFKHCADIIGITHLASGRYMEVSEAFFDTFGYTRAEVVGKISSASDQKVNTNETFPLWLRIDERNKVFQKLKKDHTLKNLETYWCTKSGKIHIGLYSAEVITIGNDPCIIYAWHDITDRKCDEEDLQEAHDQLENKVEQRTHELLSLNQELIAMNEELQGTNRELEKEITERRRIEKELSSSNQKLTQAIDKLQTMQAYLVESAKMAALGNLVAGIAHEINTPVGIGLTASSHLQELTKEFSHLCIHGTPRRQDLKNYLEELHEVATIIFKNLERAGKLIQSFKQVSADQSSELGRVFNLKKYLKEILLSMHPQLKKCNHHITLTCSDKLTLNGFPGAFSQVVSNLIMNSVIHAYDPGDQGNITITVKVEDRNILLIYTDDGKGMSTPILAKIFDPFFTTKRGHGGTGIGLHIVYNIVTQQFKGTINCESQAGCGTTFRIRLPLLKEDLSSETGTI